MICDEGHKIKNAETKVAQKLRLLPTKRRIILSGIFEVKIFIHFPIGTPIQNDLDEFFSMVDFINPGFLGSLKQFQVSALPTISDLIASIWRSNYEKS